jgi:hypothetical protein
VAASLDDVRIEEVVMIVDDRDEELREMKMVVSSLYSTTMKQV